MKPVFSAMAVAAGLLLASALPHRASTGRGPRPGPRLLTQEECRQLVLRALEDKGVNTQNPTLELTDDPYDPALPDFYNLEAHDVDVNGNYASLGSFAVDSRTADLWYSVVCWELKSPGLRRLQEVIRRRIGLTEGGYRKLRRPGPRC
jgi:hypothetical protein